MEAETHLTHGIRAARAGDFSDAAASFRRATEVNPSHAGAHNNLGSALAALGQRAAAIQAFRTAVSLEPEYAQAWVNLGDSLSAINERDEAFQCFRRALAIDPEYGSSYYSLGLAFQAEGQSNEALSCFLHAARLLPQDADVFTALGGSLMRLRRWDEARIAFESALSIDSTMAMARANLMFLLARDCDWDSLVAHMERMPELGIDGDVVPPFNLLSFEDNPQHHRLRSERYASRAFAQIEPMLPSTRPIRRPDRLRIGYFSADFREHATMFLAARMFELHDRDRFEIYAYSYGRDEEGTMRRRAQKAFDEFRDVRLLPDRAIAEMARHDRIDIAVDLKGYTEHQRVGVLAYRPAPIQITFLGYPGTLGTSFIDYLVADSVVAPGEQREAYSERLIYLPHSYQINDDTRELPELPGTRADFGLPSDGFVFCCFNSTYKVTPVEFAAWMKLLSAVDGSVLWLLASTERAQSHLRTAAQRRGVDPDRLIFAPKIAPAAHVARQRHADLFLDTFNCNAHTTASDALWGGVPLVTLAGKGFAARVAASLLNAVGLDELITTSERDYTELALALARDPDRLSALRLKLDANRRSKPLFDSELFTRHIEQAYDLAFGRFLRGQAPEDIFVSP